MKYFKVFCLFLCLTCVLGCVEGQRGTYKNHKTHQTDTIKKKSRNFWGFSNTYNKKKSTYRDNSKVKPYRTSGSRYSRRHRR